MNNDKRQQILDSYANNSVMTPDQRTDRRKEADKRQSRVTKAIGLTTMIAAAVTMGAGSPGAAVRETQELAVAATDPIVHMIANGEDAQQHMSQTERTEDQLHASQDINATHNAK